MQLLKINLKTYKTFQCFSIFIVFESLMERLKFSKSWYKHV